ncbi:MAG TPA: hypothetical protein DEP72_07325 [Clostridiales bacterium]|nr:MAG: hypothetical protein A2Y18_06435 [Clostridiales bacterium GWD2_32_19]HCC07946.1 hypothetical protein [Clostridiales bacterium]
MSKGLQINKSIMTLALMGLAVVAISTGCANNDKITTNVPSVEQNNEKISSENKKVSSDNEKVKEIVSVQKEDVVCKDFGGENHSVLIETPVINVDKDGAKEINSEFAKFTDELKKELLVSEGNYRSDVKVEWFEDKDIITVLRRCDGVEYGGVLLTIYDIENDRRATNEDLLKLYDYDYDRLVMAIQAYEKEYLYGGDTSGKETEKFINNILIDTRDNNGMINGKKYEEIEKLELKDKQKIIIENINKLRLYINKDNKLVLIWSEPNFGIDKELVIE